MFTAVHVYGGRCLRVYMFTCVHVNGVHSYIFSFLMYTVQVQCTLQVCTSYPSLLTVALQDTEQWVLPPDAGDLSEWPLAVHQANFSADFNMLMKTVWKPHAPDAVFTWLWNSHLVLWMFTRQKKFNWFLYCHLRLHEIYSWLHSWKVHASTWGGVMTEWMELHQVSNSSLVLEYFLMNVNLKLFYIYSRLVIASALVWVRKCWT